jgi:hypothetical protein
MSFWQKQDGSEVETLTSFETGGGEIEPIPNNTQLIAAIEEAKWNEYQGDNTINLKWRVMRPAQYANRVIFHKLKVFGTSRDKDKAATADKAKMMLRAIDANCGGKLSRLNTAPEDMDLMTALVGKPMAIKVQIWDMDGKTGNWISAVAPAKVPQAHATPNTAQSAQQTRQAAPQQRPVRSPTPPVYDPLDDDIPF